MTTRMPTLGFAVAVTLTLAVPVAASAQGAAPATPGQPSIEERFRRLDANGDGFITWEEARPAREAEHGRLDRNRDGALAGGEFEDRALPIGAFDSDRDGRVSLAEYLARHRKMFMGADADGDGRISLAEFIRVQQAMRGGGG